MKIRFDNLTGLLGGLALALSAANPVQAQTTTATYNPGVVIPDNDLSGVSDTVNFSTSIQSITDIQLNLDITGGYDGDFYAYLMHGSTGFAVLLNRIGVNSTSAYGSYDAGMDITLSDAGGANVHDAPATGGVLTGTWQPDGRNISPLTPGGTLDSTPSTADFSSFDGLDPNGDWTLFIADTSPVGVGTLTSWSLDVTGTSATTIPDGANAAALLGAAATLLCGIKFAMRSARSSRA